MDYSDDNCMYQFTNDQATLMDACWEAYRGGILPGAALDLDLNNNQGFTSIEYLPTHHAMAYKLTPSVQDGSQVEVRTTGNNGDADLYVSIGAVPTTSVYDYGSYGSDSYEDITFTYTGGEVYILVQAWREFSDLLLTVNTPPGAGDPPVSCTAEGERCTENGECCTDLQYNAFGNPRNPKFKCG